MTFFPLLLFAFTALMPPLQDPVEHSNHLVGETSPYLLSHAHNPVDWYPWGDEALERAKKEDKPIFLSIGYSACHWCHVMERESFENEGIAAILNEHYICIKVDREERPDLDDLYMKAVQQMTGQGGWPMSVWLTPELLPFYGGTYFPPESRYGRPGFADLLTSIQQAWETRREEIEESAKSVSGSLTVTFPKLEGEMTVPTAKAVAKRERSWSKSFAAEYDAKDGGFGAAPKFPRADDLRFLLAVAARQPQSTEGQEALTMVKHTLEKMAAGGMYDRLAGGFSRYSVDAQWHIPHFEKMLYDQGTLLPAYLEGWRLSGDPAFEKIARDTADYLLRERQDPGGAFWSSTDADSEGEEGTFFVWTPDELKEVLGEENGAFAAALYGVTAQGNFEHGKSALFAAMTPAEAAKAAGLEDDAASALQRAEDVRKALYEKRLQRIAPLSDDKILLSWNGLAMGALARAGWMLQEPRYIEAATASARFLEATLQQDDGRWLRSTRQGRTAHRAVLEDLAYFSRGLLELFMATGDPQWLALAEKVTTRMLQDFADAESGIFWDTDGQDDSLLHRLQSPWDGATPSPHAVALESLFMLHAFTGEASWREAALRGLLAMGAMVDRQPRAFASALRLFAWAAQEPAVAVVVGTGEASSLVEWQRELATAAHHDSLPVFLPSARPESPLGLLQARTPVDEESTLYLCVGQTCEAPRTLE